MLSKIVALALVLPVTIFAAVPESVLDCHVGYANANKDVTAGLLERCTFLVDFSKCLSQFPESEEMLKEVQDANKNLANCESVWKTVAGPEIRVARGDLSMTVDEAKDIKFYRHRRDELSVFDMNSTITDLFAIIADLKQQLDNKASASVVDDVDAKIAALTKSVDDSNAALTKSVEDSNTEISDAMEKLSSKIKDDVDLVKSEVDQTVKGLEAKTADAITDASASQDKKLTAGLKDITEDVSTVTTKLATVTKATVDRPIHTWIGGAKGDRHAGGWQDFMYDRVELDTSAPYFQRLSTKRFKALKDGLFRVNAHWISHDNGDCWRHRRFFVDGQSIDNGGHAYVNSWKANDIDITWYIKAGQQFWIQSYTAGCVNPYSWHSASSYKDAHNRVQVDYVGQLAGKCGSQFSLC